MFWRGGASGGYPSPRTRTVAHLIENKNADVKLVFGDWNKNMPILDAHFVHERSNLEDHLKFKYILIIDENYIASNHQWVFGSGSVPLMITSPENNWWFKNDLQPMVNYVPINYDLSDLNEKIDWLIANDKEAFRIMENALKLAQDKFSHEGQCAYLKSQISAILQNK